MIKQLAHLSNFLAPRLTHAAGSNRGLSTFPMMDARRLTRQELTTITTPTLYNIDFSMLSTTDEANKARLSSESDNAYEVKVAPGKPRFAGQGVTLQRSSLRPISLL